VVQAYGSNPPEVGYFYRKAISDDVMWQIYRAPFIEPESDRRLRDSRGPGLGATGIFCAWDDRCRD